MDFKDMVQSLNLGRRWEGGFDCALPNLPTSSPNPTRLFPLGYFKWRGEHN